MVVPRAECELIGAASPCAARSASAQPANAASAAVLSLYPSTSWPRPLLCTLATAGQVAECESQSYALEAQVPSGNTHERGSGSFEGDVSAG